MNISDWPMQDWLPMVFLGLMGVSALAYVILDGFDLGVGLLSPAVPDEERSLMIASIGPFWDANETWLVLAVGILLVAFPVAHGAILGALYLPTTLMLIGLTLRGVAFEFRAKGPSTQRAAWDRAFFAGSFLATASQGLMLGYYIIGLEDSWRSDLFAALVAVCLTAGYALVGACWLIAKTVGELGQSPCVWHSHRCRCNINCNTPGEPTGIRGMV
jgi:cytochrome d ubiquinol oxidase subunit II